MSSGSFSKLSVGTPEPPASGCGSLANKIFKILTFFWVNSTYYLKVLSQTSACFCIRDSCLNAF